MKAFDAGQTRCKKEGLLTVHKKDEMRGYQRRVKMQRLVKFQMGRKNK
jgi:hypothetical protein